MTSGVCRLVEGVIRIFINVLLVFFGGALGAMSRYLLGFFVNQRTDGRLPYGTLVVNFLGCVVIGLITRNALVIGSHGVLLTDMGFTGAFTTFSSLSYETIILIEQGQWLEAFLNPVISVLLGLFGVSLGMMAGVGW